MEHGTFDLQSYFSNGALKLTCLYAILKSVSFSKSAHSHSSSFVFFGR